MADLFGVLLAMVLGDRGQHVLDELAVAVLAKLDGGAFQPCADRSDGGAQFQMRVQIAGKARDVVDDHYGVMLAVLAQPGQHLLDRGAIHQTAGDAFVFEDFFDGIALVGGEFAAAALLAGKPVALGKLRLGGHTGIDDGRVCAHGRGSFLCGGSVKDSASDASCAPLSAPSCDKSCGQVMVTPRAKRCSIAAQRRSRSSSEYARPSPCSCARRRYFSRSGDMEYAFQRRPVGRRKNL
nr:hypothetical protein [Mesobacterium pallidum]